MQKHHKKHFTGLGIYSGIEFFNAVFQQHKDWLTRTLTVAYKNVDLSGGVYADSAASEPLPFNASAFTHAEFDIKDTPNFLKLVHVREEIDLNPEVMTLKRLFDIVFSLILMFLGFPIFAAIYIITKISSPGPVFYKQERVGKHEQKFHIYKFRSMHVDAEKYGPQLSNADDPRITKWGRVMRRSRLDELPQFWNVLRGDMSVVGPRPERRYFVDKIVEINPDYKKLHLIRPGITSLGQVHYGYAESVEQMCDRLKYDLQYLQKINLRADIVVILRTVKVMTQCKGK
ncbi:Sugar transferase involved in LPS biosynthesis (colanic, teichoic acid) [Mucilaginibacter pineti]|uniref:Sugar transferase involved in LPS biosynthesis (Colanic, teichoic acid) n=1 Tax=Mucilaginibacter pineti TaxID=1391627 RepID=A0A1G6Z0T5_9SPHI|nr:sugar transferase [Mucilaginibacter pineti]SDD96142.1 Sugar transferase involved in LPS biosynthesis (colanic, teichoic acid) [Mucilaginibacter pineti]